MPPAARLRAILDQIDAALARGEAAKALSIAQQASAEGFDGDLSSAEDLNNAGVIAELHGDRLKAMSLYQRALQTGASGRIGRPLRKTSVE